MTDTQKPGLGDYSAPVIRTTKYVVRRFQYKRVEHLVATLSSDHILLSAEQEGVFAQLRAKGLGFTRVEQDGMNYKFYKAVSQLVEL